MPEVGLTLGDHLSKSCVCLGLEADGSDAAISLLARKAESCGLVGDHRSFLEKLRAREAEMSTGVGRGLAVPHAVVAGAQSTFVIGATLSESIDYQAIDDVPVDIIFLIGGKPGEVGLHLQLLARIARLARQPEFLVKLRDQNNAAGFIEAVEAAEGSLYSVDG